MLKLITTLLVIIVFLTSTVASAVAFGGPTQLPPMQSINDPFRSVDFSNLPHIRTYTARDGAQLAFREYSPDGEDDKGSVVIVHGSSSRSDNVHVLAQGLAKAGYSVYAPDIRGHGRSGNKGQINYIGQLEDDLEDFMKVLHLSGAKSLIGFSVGGGFALRFAADKRQSLFNNYLLMSPFLSQSASTYRPAGGGWATVGMPRIIGLIVLNLVGISKFNYLPVTAYAVEPEMQKILTPRYSFALALNFRPHNNYRADIVAAAQPMEVLVGEQDAQFFSQQFAAEFSGAGRSVPVTVVPAIGHVELTLNPIAIAEVVKAIRRLNKVNLSSPKKSDTVIRNKLEGKNSWFKEAMLQKE